MPGLLETWATIQTVKLLSSHHTHATQGKNPRNVPHLCGGLCLRHFLRNLWRSLQAAKKIVPRGPGGQGKGWTRMGKTHKLKSLPVFYSFFKLSFPSLSSTDPCHPKWRHVMPPAFFRGGTASTWALLPLQPIVGSESEERLTRRGCFLMEPKSAAKQGIVSEEWPPISLRANRYYKRNGGIFFKMDKWQLVLS